METEERSVRIREPVRTVDSAFLWNVWKRFAWIILLTATVGSVLAGLLRSVGTADTYTVNVRFLVHTIHSVQDPETNEWRITVDPGDVMGAADISASAGVLLGEDPALQAILDELQGLTDPTNVPTEAELRSMMRIVSEGQILTVSLSSSDADEVWHTAHAVKRAIPSVLARYFGISEGTAVEQTGAQAVALTDLDASKRDIAVSVSHPSVWPFVGLGGLAAAAVAFLLALLRVYHDSCLYSSEDISRFCSLPVLGIIPEGQARRRRGARPQESEASLLSQKAPTAKVTAYECLRTSLLRQARGECLVYGIVPDTRATQVFALSANLAMSCARMGKRVLLIDGDLRCPNRPMLFPQEKRKSELVDLLTGRVNRETALLHTGSYPDVISVNRIPHNPSELLASSAMTDLLHIARTRYDVILLNFPSPEECGDALLLTDCMTGYLIAVCAGRSKANDLKRVCEVLERFDAPMTGVVLLDPTAE